MTPAPLLPLVVARFHAQASAATPTVTASRAAVRHEPFWSRFRPLAFLAPLAVNWPGGRMVF